MAANYTTLISVADARALHGEALIIDCRFDLMDPAVGYQQYLAGHIPGAHYANLNTDLSDPGVPNGGRHPLPEREAFAATVRGWGLNQDQQVIAYDQGPGAYAARLWWMLRWLGHERVAVLDGGFAAWQQEGPVDAEPVSPVAGNFTPGPARSEPVTAADVANHRGLLLDARDTARFRGETEPVDPVAGHIPGASCRPFTSNLTDGHFKTVAALNAEFGALGDLSDAICYCGSGVTATHNILALVHCGLPEPRLYAGSWSGWISDPDRPIATGE